MHILYSCVHTHGHIHVHVHMTHSGAQCASHSDRVCALQVDVCIPVYCAVVDTNMDVYTYIQVLDGCLTVTDRVSRRCL